MMYNRNTIYTSKNYFPHKDAFLSSTELQVISSEAGTIRPWLGSARLI